jgi:hypothetical protein
MNIIFLHPLIFRDMLGAEGMVGTEYHSDREEQDSRSDDNYDE